MKKGMEPNFIIIIIIIIIIINNYYIIIITTKLTNIDKMIKLNIDCIITYKPTFLAVNYLVSSTY